VVVQFSINNHPGLRPPLLTEEGSRCAWQMITSSEYRPKESKLTTPLLGEEGWPKAGVVANKSQTEPLPGGQGYRFTNRTFQRPKTVALCKFYRLRPRRF